MIVTGIGSRLTPKHVLQEMEKIGKYCRDNNIAIRSGHAEGADWAFEKGAQQLCTIYLPWASFNREWKSLAVKVVVEPSEKLIELVKKYHPAPDKLSQGAMKLMARNCCQVLGKDLNSPTDLVICFTSDGKASGGTGQAIRMAEDLKIPVVNMFHEKHSTAEKVISLLGKN